MKKINNIEAEQTMIGLILNDSDLIVEYPSLGVNHFSINQHKILINSLLEMHSNSIDININSLTAHLLDKKQYDEVGGVEYINDIANSIFSVNNSKYFYDILEEKKKQRELLSISKALTNSLNKENIDINGLLDLTYKSLDEIAYSDDSTLKSISELNNESYKRFTNKLSNGIKFEGLLSGYKNLDNLIGSFKKSSVIIIAARPSVGKTAFALNLAINTAKNNKDTNVCIFSLEMSAEELYERILSRESKVSGYKYKFTKFNEYEIGKDYEAREKLKELNIYVDDKALIKVSEMNKICKKLKKEKGSLGLVIIDYLQLIEPGAKGDNKQVQIAQISRELKQLAKELDVCVIALSQLSREVEKRPNQRPVLSDLRDSGAIEADADIVTLLYRPDYQSKDVEDTSEVELIIAKNRSGKTGTVDFLFDKSVSEFYEAN